MRTLLAIILLLGVMPAEAGPVFVTEPDASGATITLHDDAGPCEGDAKMAVWRSADATRSVRGCWIFAGIGVWVSFLDGERGDFRLAILRKVKDS